LKKRLAFLIAVVIFFTVHEGAHALVSSFYGEYEAFHVRPLGMEVTFKTPVEARTGIQWAFISGVSNVVTLALGYVLLMFADKFNRLESTVLKASVYYLTLFGLLLDALNLSIGPFIYGGDANGIAVGLGVSRYLIQLIFFLIFVVNRELVAQRLLPAYNVETRHPFFRPLIKLGS